MTLIDNKDYRLNHDLKILYMPHRLYHASYQSGHEANYLTWEWAKKGYRIQHHCSDHFIQTGEEQRSPDYWTDYKV